MEDDWPKGGDPPVGQSANVGALALSAWACIVVVCRVLVHWVVVHQIIVQWL